MEELTLGERRRRTFSESFKRKKVQEIETGQARICEICRAYQVSYTNVYRWIKKYGSMSKKQERLIVETESDSVKLIELQKKVAELERIIGQKQIEIDFKDKMIDIAEEMYGVDIKKKLCTQPSSTSETTERSTRSL